MKRISFLIFLIGFLSVAFFVLPQVAKDNPDSPTPSPAVLGKPDIASKYLVDLPYSDSSIRIAWIEVPDSATVTLHANFENQQNSQAFSKENDCRAIVNGGFYTEDNKPTGLFVSDETTLRGWQENVLLNGVLSVNELDTPRITKLAPIDPLRFALQTGPILIENDTIQKLALKNDKEARRIVAAITGDNTLYFLVFYNPESLFVGPLLIDMPMLLTQFEKETKISFADAINLDGGSASAFITDDLSLTEYSPVGSFFCVQ